MANTQEKASKGDETAQEDCFGRSTIQVDLF